MQLTRQIGTGSFIFFMCAQNTPIKMHIKNRNSNVFALVSPLSEKHVKTKHEHELHTIGLLQLRNIINKNINYR